MCYPGVLGERTPAGDAANASRWAIQSQLITVEFAFSDSSTRYFWARSGLTGVSVQPSARFGRMLRPERRAAGDTVDPLRDVPGNRRWPEKCKGEYSPQVIVRIIGSKAASAISRSVCEPFRPVSGLSSLLTLFRKFSIYICLFYN